jgi:hypothetical protein
MEEFAKIIRKMRDIEQEYEIDYTPIWVFIENEETNCITDLADEGLIDEPRMKPSDQDIYMEYILN